jgi:hypothetical protein
MTRCKNIRKLKTEFVETTHVHGISFIHVTKSKIEIAFWVIAICACFYLLCDNIVQITEQYIVSPTHVEASIFEKFYTFP